MALIEVEMSTGKFNQLVQLLASAGPIPIGILNGLGSDRLIAEFTWNQVEVGLGPPGINTPVGTLVARCALMLRHVSTAELDANANATGISTAATGWIGISATTVDLRVHLLAIEVGRAPTQWFTPPIFFARRPIPKIGTVNLASAALVSRDDIVTLRFATRATDSLRTVPSNLLASTGDEWAIRLSGEFFTEQLLQSLQAALAQPPAGTTIEEQPSASWGMKDGNWAVIGSVGLEKKDACPSLFGDVDVSVTVDVVMTPSANTVALQSPQLTLILRLSSNASDWDVARCWLGGGGIASAILGYIATPIVGPAWGGLGFLAGGIVSLVVVAETVRLDAEKQVSETSVNGFSLISSSETEATYSSQNKLPTLVTTTPNGSSNGSITAATTGPHGMLISGRITYLPAIHNVIFDPDGGSLASTLRNSFRCRHRSWVREATIRVIQIEDRANVLGTDLGPVLVTVFPSSTAAPSNLWSIEDSTPSPKQFVTILGSESVMPGDVGRVYLHTSAGIRRFDISPLPAVAEPTQEETIARLVRCYNNSKIFTPTERIRWLVDPPPHDFGFPPFRQWLFTFAKLPAATRIVIRRIGQGIRNDDSMVFASEKTGEASLELITDAASELILEHNQEVISDGRLSQRWLIPSKIIDTGAPGQGLVRSGSLIAVIQQGGIFTHDLSTGSSMRHVGQLRLARLPWGGLEAIEHTRRRLDGALNEQRIRASEPRLVGGIQHDILPFSLTLPGGKVAALHESKLVIGIPWQSDRIILG